MLAAWRAAEERLYPMIMVVPEAYERVVRLVGEATVELQLACPDLPSLVATAPGVADNVRRLAAANGFGEGLDFPLIAASACLMRYRQLESDTHRDQRRRLIAAAVEAGGDWVILAQGAAPTTWPPMPSATVEMHLASGRALEETTTIDEATGAPRFSLSEIQLDPSTGERGGDEPDGSGGREEFDDLSAWRAAIAAKRGMIGRSH
jgi:hypothetical protein